MPKGEQEEQEFENVFEKILLYYIFYITFLLCLCILIVEGLFCYVQFFHTLKCIKLVLNRFGILTFLNAFPIIRLYVVSHVIL